MMSPSAGHRWMGLVLSLAANAVFLGAVLGILWLGRRRGIPDHELLRDPVMVSHGPLHAGLLSNVGVLIWAGGAGAVLFAGVLLLADPATRRAARLLLAVGALTAFLATDDLLMFHEGAGFGGRLGIPEQAFVGAYVIATIAIAFVYRDLIVALPQRWLLLVAVGAFGVAVGIDVLDRDLMYLTEEDVAKLVGIFNWTLGWSAAAHHVLRAALSSERASRP